MATFGKSSGDVRGNKMRTERTTSKELESGSTSVDDEEEPPLSEHVSRSFTRIDSLCSTV
ncbi:hypothetical protein DPMN_155713 [Dreissena polymorpha]|uniref:Uncharacterized protein n=1 Tax=Dreissena polymorpha TaxID=45954 RepID=A0A9D4FS93_DREPO|nr:hypothetical protein DPMN_155713 [Dreissena polymorpha]